MIDKQQEGFSPAQMEESLSLMQERVVGGQDMVKRRDRVSKALEAAGFKSEHFALLQEYIEDYVDYRLLRMSAAIYHGINFDTAG
jgi:hypothetical protein